MNFSVLAQVLGFLIANKETFRQIISGIEELAPDAPGTAKAGAVRGIVGDALNIAKEIDAVWPLVLPVFNLLVSSVKSR